MESVFQFWGNIERKAKGLIPLQVFPAVVTAVDEEARTCTVKVNDNVEFEDVRLYAVVDSGLKGFCLVPAVDSTVLAGRIAGSNELYVVMSSEVDKVLGTIGDKVEMAMDAESVSYTNDKTEITVKSAGLTAKIGGVTLEIQDNKVAVDADEIVFNGGDNKGLAKVDEIKKNLDAIKNYVEAMNTAIATGLNGVGLGPSASGSAGATAYQGGMAGQSIVFGAMDNSAVKH